MCAAPPACRSHSAAQPATLRPGARQERPTLPVGQAAARRRRLGPCHLCSAASCLGARSGDGEVPVVLPGIHSIGAQLLLNAQQLRVGRGRDWREGGGRLASGCSCAVEVGPHKCRPEAAPRRQPCSEPSPSLYAALHVPPVPPAPHLVVLGQALGAARRARLDLARAQAHRQVGDEGVLGLARPAGGKKEAGRGGKRGGRLRRAVAARAGDTHANEHYPIGAGSVGRETFFLFFLFFSI